MCVAHLDKNKPPSKNFKGKRGGNLENNRLDVTSLNVLTVTNAELVLQLTILRRQMRA